MTTIPIHDATLVSRTLKGDDQSFETLVQRHLRTVRAIAGLYAQSPSDVDDLVQDSFLKAYVSLDSLKDRKRFGGWMASIVRNTAIRHSQNRKRDNDLKKAMAEADAAHDYQRPEEHELFTTVRNLTNQLDETHREVLVLHYFAGHECREIGRLLNIRHAAVRKRLQRAREALSAELLTSLEVAAPSKDDAKSRAKTIAGIATGASVAWGNSAQAATGITSGVFGAAVAATGTAAILAVAAAALLLQPSAPKSSGSVATAQVAAQSSTNESTASEPGAPQAAASESQAASATETATLPTGPGTLGARFLLPNGEPATNAHITMIRRTWEPHERLPRQTETWKGTTDNNGITRSEDLPRGDYGVWVTTDDGYASLFDSSVTTYHLERFAEITLDYAADLTGRVTDPDGGPVTNARVLVVEDIENDEVYDAAGDMTTQFTDDDGQFTIAALPIKQYRLFVETETQGTALERISVGDGAHVEIELDRPSTISGVAIDLNSSAPVPNAKLLLLSENARHRPSAVADEDGNFSFTGVATGSYTVAADDPILIATPHDSIRARRGRTTENISVVMTEGMTVRGRVEDETTGKIMTGITVNASPRGILALERSAVANVDGKYEITGLAPGKYMVSPESPIGYRQPFGRYQRGKETDIVLGTNSIVNDVQLEQAVILKGRVTHDGAPVPYARVGIAGGVNTYVGGSVISDEHGEYAIRYVPVTGDLWLTGMHGDMLARPQELEFDEPGVQSANIEIGASASATGRLVDDSGKPMAGVYVISSLDGARSGGSRGETDSNGRFELNKIEPGVHNFYIQLNDGPGHLSDQWRLGTHEFDFGDTAAGLQFVFERGGSVAGRVVDEDGNPLANVRVSTDGGDMITKEDGLFRFDGVRGELRMVSAHTPGRFYVSVNKVPENTDALEIVLLPQAQVSGRVVDASTGEPLTEFSLGSSFWETENLSGFILNDMTRFSSEDGSFSVPIFQATVRTFWASAPGYAMGNAVVRCVPGSQVDDVIIELEKGGAVTGRIRSASGQPMPNVNVYIGEPLPSVYQSNEFAAKSDADGNFILENMPTWPTLIWASAEGFPPAIAFVTAGESADLRFVEDSPISVRVMRGQSPVGEARFHYSLPGADIEGHSIAERTEADGSATIRGIPPQATSLIASMRLNDEFFPSVSLPIPKSSSTPLIINMPYGSSAIEGKIANWDPTTMSSALVYVIQRDGNIEYKTYHSVGWSGTFRFDELPVLPTRLKVTIYRNYDVPLELEYEVDVEAGETSLVTIEL